MPLGTSLNKIPLNCSGSGLLAVACFVDRRKKWLKYLPLLSEGRDLQKKYFKMSPCGAKVSNTGNIVQDQASREAPQGSPMHCSYQSLHLPSQFLRPQQFQHAPCTVSSSTPSLSLVERYNRIVIGYTSEKGPKGSSSPTIILLDL